jgi:hypothetical protein
MNKPTFTLILIIILSLFYIGYFNTNISNFENLEFKDSLIIMVTDNEFYYINIKPQGQIQYDVFRIPLYLVKDFY